MFIKLVLIILWSALIMMTGGVWSVIKPCAKCKFIQKLPTLAVEKAGSMLDSDRLYSKKISNYSSWRHFFREKKRIFISPASKSNAPFYVPEIAAAASLEFLTFLTIFFMGYRKNLIRDFPLRKKQLMQLRSSFTRSNVLTWIIRIPGCIKLH